MGCDIHCFIEYKTKGSDHWSDFGAEIDPGRNYWMFGFLAGVRADFTPVAPPRGMPADIAYGCSDRYWLYVSDDGKGHRECTKETAERWVSSKCSVYKDAENKFVSDPDSHTHSWLNSAEFELAIASYLKRCGFQVGALHLTDRESTSELATQTDKDGRSPFSGIAEYWTILAALRCFEMQGHEARLVFWFDN